MWPFIKMVNIHIEIGVSVFVVITAYYKFIRNSTVITEDVAVVIERERERIKRKTSKFTKNENQNKRIKKKCPQDVINWIPANIWNNVWHQNGISSRAQWSHSMKCCTMNDTRWTQRNQTKQVKSSWVESIDSMSCCAFISINSTFSALSSHSNYGFCPQCDFIECHQQ